MTLSWDLSPSYHPTAAWESWTLRVQLSNFFQQDASHGSNCRTTHLFAGYDLYSRTSSTGNRMRFFYFSIAPNRLMSQLLLLLSSCH